MIYHSKYFQLEELVDENTYNTKGVLAWDLFTVVLLQSLDDLREYFGVPITVNNWSHGGQLQWRGWRPENCLIGSKTSQHKKGNAIDGDIKNKTAEQVRQEVLANKDHPLLRNITCIEANVGWFHFDFRQVDKRIKIIYP